MSETQDAAATSDGAENAPAKVDTPNAATMPLGDLKNLLDANPDNSRLGILGEEPPVVETEESTEAAEEVEAATEETTEEAVEESTESEEVEAPAGDEAATDTDMDLLQLQVSKLERKLSSREGKYGSQQQLVDRLNAEIEELKGRLDGGDDLDDQTTRRPAKTKTSDSNTAYLLEQASNQTAAQFLAQHDELLNTDGTLVPEFQVIMKRAMGEAQLPETPRELQGALTLVLANAYDDFKIEKIQKERAGKRGEQAESLKKKKRTASLATSGGKPARVKKDTFDPATAPIEELRKRLDERYDAA